MHQRSYIKYFLPILVIKDYNVMNDGRNFFDQPVKNDLKTYDNVKKNAIAQGDDYSTGCLLDYFYFEKHNELIAIYLTKQKVFGVDPKANQQIDFTGS